MDDLSEATIRQLVRTAAFADGYAEGVRAAELAVLRRHILQMEDGMNKAQIMACAMLLDALAAVPRTPPHAGNEGDTP